MSNCTETMKYRHHPYEQNLHSRPHHCQYRYPIVLPQPYHLHPRRHHYHHHHHHPPPPPEMKDHYVASLDPKYLAQQTTGLGNELEQCHVELKMRARQELCLAEEEGGFHHRHHYHL